MKKKFRVYKKGGRVKCKEGGNIQATQDSGDDNMPQQKKNNFIEWIRKNTQESLMKKAIPNDLKLIMSKAQFGGPTFDDPYVQQPIQPFGPMDDPNKKPDPNKRPEQTGYDQYGNIIIDPVEIAQINQDVYDAQLPYNEQISIDPADMELADKEHAEYQDAFQPVDPYATNSMMDKLKDLHSTSPYLLPTMGLNALQAIGNFGNRDERIAEEERLRSKMSNVHNVYAATGSDRGDYMVNTPGIGDPLKPDEHLRKGYNTKVAQTGGQIGDELELSDEEIAELLAQGYELDII